MYGFFFGSLPLKNYGCFGGLVCYYGQSPLPIVMRCGTTYWYKGGDVANFVKIVNSLQFQTGQFVSLFAVTVKRLNWFS